MHPIPTERYQSGPAEIEAEIRFYMQLYLKQRVWFISHTVAERLDTLLGHPDFNATFAQRCGFVRLAKQWRCLASIDRMTMTASIEQSNEPRRS